MKTVDYVLLAAAAVALFYALKPDGRTGTVTAGPLIPIGKSSPIGGMQTTIKTAPAPEPVSMPIFGFDFD